ncbi:hypothetical protein BC628DRAFT_458510 [Trametes gibbosa]|nr:hypothetical protein BC628DRAFT_458510 [Trametes gibbosa]
MSSRMKSRGSSWEYSGGGTLYSKPYVCDGNVYAPVIVAHLPLTVPNARSRPPTSTTYRAGERLSGDATERSRAAITTLGLSQRSSPPMTHGPQLANLGLVCAEGSQYCCTVVGIQAVYGGGRPAARHGAFQARTMTRRPHIDSSESTRHPSLCIVGHVHARHAARGNWYIAVHVCRSKYRKQQRWDNDVA